MKNTLLTLGSVLGGVMVGFFANRLTTLPGAIFFTAGVILLGFSIFLRTKQKK